MNKRSAILVAAGVVAAMFAGALALTSSTTPAAVASTSNAKETPRVRVIERTRTIHRQAKPAPAVVTTIAAPATSSTGSFDDDDHGDDAFESEHESDDDHESDDGSWDD